MVSIISLLQECISLDSRVSENFVLANELIAKAFRILESCVFVNNKLYGKIVSSLKSPDTFGERFKVTFFIPDFDLF